jgi:acyl carrier protein
MDVEQPIKRYIESNILSQKGGGTLSPEDSLLESGLIDSAGIFSLVAFLESEFNITVPDEDIVPEHFETLKSVAAYVESRQRG